MRNFGRASQNIRFAGKAEFTLRHTDRHPAPRRLRLSNPEISYLVGCTLATAKARVHRARCRLRETLRAASVAVDVDAALAILDGVVVDACVAALHQAVVVEFPVFVAVAAPLLTVGIA